MTLQQFPFEILRFSVDSFYSSIVPYLHIAAPQLRHKHDKVTHPRSEFKFSISDPWLVKIYGVFLLIMWQYRIVLLLKSHEEVYHNFYRLQNKRNKVKSFFRICSCSAYQETRHTDLRDTVCGSTFLVSGPFHSVSIA
jgi:hypothetical protein